MDAIVMNEVLRAAANILGKPERRIGCAVEASPLEISTFRINGQLPEFLERKAALGLGTEIAKVADVYLDVLEDKERIMPFVIRGNAVVLTPAEARQIADALLDAYALVRKKL